MPHPRCCSEVPRYHWLPNVHTRSVFKILSQRPNSMSSHTKYKLYSPLSSSRLPLSFARPSQAKDIQCMRISSPSLSVSPLSASPVIGSVSWVQSTWRLIPQASSTCGLFRVTSKCQASLFPLFSLSSLFQSSSRAPFLFSPRPRPHLSSPPPPGDRPTVMLL